MKLVEKNYEEAKQYFTEALKSGIVPIELDKEEIKNKKLNPKR